MLQLAGDLSLAQEPPPDVRVAAAFRTQFLQRDLAVELLVIRQPDLADATFAMHMSQRVARHRFVGRLRVGDQRLHDDVAAVRPTGEGLADVGIVDLLQDIADRSVGDGSQRGVDVADEPLQLPLDLAFEFGAALLRQPLPLDEQLRDRTALVGGPRSANRRELREVDVLVLKRQDAKQQVAIGLHVGYLFPVEKISQERISTPLQVVTLSRTQSSQKQKPSEIRGLLLLKMGDEGLEPATSTV